MFKVEFLDYTLDSGTDDESAVHLNTEADNEFQLKLPVEYSDSEDELSYVPSPYANQWVKINAVPCNSDRKFPSNSQSYCTEVGGAKEERLAVIKRGSILSAFQVLFDEQMVDKIVQYTQMAANRTSRYADWEFSRKDLYLYLAILLGKASCDARHWTISDMFSVKWGSPFFSKCMNKTTFEIVNRFLRFDDKSTREERLATDPEAIVSEVWNRFNENCQQAFEAGATVAIDMQLAACEARCPFVQAAPDVDGLKQTGLMYSLVVDPEQGYVLNSKPYFHPERPTRSERTLDIAKDLLTPFLNKRRTVIASEIFTSVDLASHLISSNTYFVGAYRTNHPDLPHHLQKRLARYANEIYSLAKSATLTRYKYKYHQEVSILSSRHPTTVYVSNHLRRIPDTYDLYKTHSDAVKQITNKTKSCSTWFLTPRWTIFPFCNLLDLAVHNAQILYHAATGLKQTKRDFLQYLAEEIATHHLPSYVSSPNFKAELLLDPSLLPPELQDLDQSTLLSKGKRQRCKVRATAACKQNKTTILCQLCQKQTCTTCSSMFRGICSVCWDSRHEAKGNG